MTDDERAARLLGWWKEPEDKRVRTFVGWRWKDTNNYSYNAPDIRNHPATVLAALELMLSSSEWVLENRGAYWEWYDPEAMAAVATKVITSNFKDAVIDGFIAYHNETGWPDNKWQGD